MPRPSYSTPGWSPDEALWDELARISCDLIWKKVKFDASYSHLVSNQKIGVYLICANTPKEAIKQLSAYTVLYAGQVRSHEHGLQARFLEHVRNPKIKLQWYIKCYYPNVHFWFAHVDDASLIDELETLLIEAFNPPCNSISAPSSSAIIARIGAGRPIGRH